MPDVEDQSKASCGACFSTFAHNSCLKARFSGPDSWITCASETAEDSEVAMRILEMEAAEGSVAKNLGRFSDTYSERLGRTS